MNRIATVTGRLLLAAACFAALAGLVAACMQQEGDRCQLDSDCDTGLICNQATQQCANPNSNEPIDATTPDFLDSDLEDAMVDAMDDAIDAT